MERKQSDQNCFDSDESQMRVSSQSRVMIVRDPLMRDLSVGDSLTVQLSESVISLKQPWQAR